MSRPIVIIGAGGFGRHAHDVIEAINEESPTFEMLGFLDDGQPDEQLLAERDSRHLGRVSKLEGLPADVGYLIGIGIGKVRRDIDRWATSIGRDAIIAAHPTVTFGRNVTVAPGVVLCSHTSIGTNIRVGRHTHLNFNCTIGHDANLGPYVTAYPGANIAGNVRIGDAATIGTGAAIIQGLSIGEGAIIGAGAAVVADVPADVTAVGVPARPRSLGGEPG